MENKASYAENFRIRIGQIQQEVAPIARSNGAMAFTRKRAQLVAAMTMFKGLLKFSGERTFPWFVRFPDRSECTLGANDTFEELKILRSLEPRAASRSRTGSNFARRAHA
jgi:hypothetical protein